MCPQSLAIFLRKRDPRYKTHLAAQAAAASSSASTPRGARTPSSRPPPPARAAQPEFVAQDWQKAQTVQDAEDLEWAAAENAQEEWECVACGKTFRSEAAWDSHERSRKHLKAVEELKRQMREESEELGLEGDDARAREEDADAEDDELSEEPPKTPVLSEAGDVTSGPEGEQEAIDSEDDGDEPQSTAKNKTSSTQPRTSVPEDDASEGDLLSSTPTKRKGKQPRPASPEAHSKSRRKARARDESSSETTPSKVTSRLDVHTENDPVAEGEPEPGAAVPPRPPELSKREKRRAREAAKATRAETEGAAAAKEVSVWTSLRKFSGSRGQLR